MSENANVPENPTPSPETKEKIKKILPVVAVVVVLLIIVKIISSIGGGGKAMNKKAMKLLLKHNASKILAIMPEGYDDDVIKFYNNYVQDKKQLKDAVKQETVSRFEELGKVKKIKYLENFKIDLKDLQGSGLDSSEEISIKSLIDGVGYIWKELKDCDEGYMTIVEITFKNKDGDKETEIYPLCSFKYEGKWYSLNAMSAVYNGAWGYTPKAKRGK